MTLSRELTTGFNELWKMSKTSLTIRAITRTRNTEDDITETNSDTAVEGIVMPIEDYYSNEDAGMLSLGTHVAFFKPAVNGVTVTNKLVKGTTVYSITRVENAEVDGDVVYQMAVLDKRT